MDKYLFLKTFPRTKLKIQESLGIGILTNIQLLDYFLNNSSDEVVHVKNLSNDLPKGTKKDLEVLRTVFAHGVTLRNYYISNVENLNQGWEEFIGWWEGLNEEEVTELIIYGIRESMNYYYKYLPKMQEVEEIMKEVNLETNQLINKENREKALEAVLKSWSVDNIDEILPFYLDVIGIKQRIINLLEGVWQSGFKKDWESKKSSISNWRSKITSLLNKSYGMNIDAIYNITGLYPDTSHTDEINRARIITFVPVPNMGKLITFYEFDQNVYLMFEPNLLKEKNSPRELDKNETYLAFEGLGDTNRLQIINLLSKYEEMYAQQIVERLEMKQSTVSRHLNQLQQSNLVKVRQVGNTKYFSLNRDEIQKVIEVLETFIR